MGKTAHNKAAAHVSAAAAAAFASAAAASASAAAASAAAAATRRRLSDIAMAGHVKLLRQLSPTSLSDHHRESHR